MICSLAVAAASVLGASVACGQTFFDNLSLTNAQTGYTFGAHTSYAQRFSSGSGGAISNISLNLFNNTPDPFVGVFVVSIYGDTGGSGPGALAFDYFLGNENNLGTFGGTPITLTGNVSGFDTLMQPSTTYWLVVQRGTSATNGASLDWGGGDNSQGGAGQNYMALSVGGSWTEISGFSEGFGAEIVGVPEPSTYALLVLSGVGAGVHIMRRRRE